MTIRSRLDASGTVRIATGIPLAMCAACALAGSPIAAQRSPIAEFYVDPVRIVWRSEQGVGDTRTLFAPHRGLCSRPPSRHA